MQIFEYCAIYVPTEEQLKEGDKYEIIIEPTVILAEKEKTAALKAARKIPEKYADKLEQVEIKIRPF